MRTRTRLEKLTWEADISPYVADLWFRGSRLEKSVLLVPDAESGQSLEKLFGAALRRVIPDLRITVAPFQAEAPSILNAAGKRWQAQQAKLTESE